MSLRCGDENFYPPELWRYEYRATFPESERCPTCEGLGIYQWRNSDFGPEEGKDWRECWICNGSGRVKCTSKV